MFLCGGLLSNSLMSTGFKFFVPAGPQSSNGCYTSGMTRTSPVTLQNKNQLERRKANADPIRGTLSYESREHFLRQTAALLPLERTNKNSKTDTEALYQDRLTVADMIRRLASRCAFLRGTPGGAVIPAMLMAELTLTRASALLKTQVQYADNLFLFCDYLEQGDIILNSAEDLDYTLSYFGQRYMTSGVGSKSYFGNIVSSIGLFFPRLKKELSTSWALFAGWTSIRPAKQRLPMPHQIKLLMIADLCAHNKFRVAAMIWTGFHTWMRREELASVTGADYLPIKAGSRSSVYGIFRLPDNKSGLVQSVSVTDHDLHSLIMKLKTTSLPSSRLFVTGATLEKHMLLSGARLGFPELRFTPHSLRHGGATDAILNGMAVDDVRLRGRWAHLATVLRYVQSGIVAKILDTLPSSLLKDFASFTLLNPLSFFGLAEAA